LNLSTGRVAWKLIKKIESTEGTGGVQVRKNEGNEGQTPMGARTVENRQGGRRKGPEEIPGNPPFSPCPEPQREGGDPKGRHHSLEWVKRSNFTKGKTRRGSPVGPIGGKRESNEKKGLPLPVVPGAGIRLGP